MPYYPPGTRGVEVPDPRPVFKDARELARHQAERLRAILGDELYEWLDSNAETREAGDGSGGKLD